MVSMFHATCLLWVFFRAASFDDAMGFLSRMVSGPYDVRWPVLQCLIVMTCGALHPIDVVVATRSLAASMQAACGYSDDLTVTVGSQAPSRMRDRGPRRSWFDMACTCAPT